MGRPARVPSERPAKANKGYHVASRRISAALRRPSQASLSLSGLKLDRLPPTLAKLTALRELDLSDNKLSAPLPEIASLAALQELNLSRNRLSDLPAEVVHLTELRALRLSGNQLSALPPEIARLAELKLLLLPDNLLTELPPAVAQLRALQEINLTNNRLTVLPPEIARLPQLSKLSIGSNKLTTLPPEIGQLTNLRDLYVYGNRLTELPVEIGNLSALQILSAADNSFELLPSTIKNLTALLRLYLQNNRLKAFPLDLTKLSNLQILNIADNQLAVLPDEIRQLQKLEALMLENNQLTTLPTALGHLRSLEAVHDSITGLFLTGNPLPYPYPVLLADGHPKATSNILAWLRGELNPEAIETALKPSDDESETIEPADDELDRILHQRPAAFRFGQRDGQIDVLPEPTNVFDSEAAKDLYTELLDKTRALAERLMRANSDPRVQASVARLLQTLGASLEDVRPGLLLSRSRSIEADRNAFNTPQSRRELFPDAIAVMDDVLLSLRDLLAAFPAVRQIDTEQLALALQRDAQTTKTARQSTNAVQDAAAKSNAATPQSVSALKEQDPDIEAARNPTVRAGLIADQLLVVRNFASEALRAAKAGGRASTAAVAAGLRRVGAELTELGGESWQQVKENLPKGIGNAAKIAPTGAMLLLLVNLVGPVGALAALRTGGFKELAKAIRKSVGRKAGGKLKAKTGAKKAKIAKKK